jgi:hypothetical protein
MFLLQRIARMARRDEAVRDELLSTFLRRFLASHRKATVFKFYICSSEQRSTQDGNPVVPFELLVREVSQVVNCDDEVAEALVRWSIAVARHRPKLFTGFTALPIDPSGVCLTEEEEGDEDLEFRWSYRLPERQTGSVQAEEPDVAVHASAHLVAQ